MAITRVQTETALVARCESYMAAAGLATTIVGTNADLNDPMVVALLDLGYTVADYSLVADSDIAQVQADEIVQYLDLAELRLLETILQNLALFDVEIGERNEKKSQLARNLQAAINAKSKAIADKYGTLTPAIGVGRIELLFAEHDEDNTDELGY